MYGRIHYKMFAVRGGLTVFGIFVLTISASRVVRSPDKMEVNIPNYSLERDSGEYQANMNEEAAYWHEQGDQLANKEEEGHHQLEQDRDKNQQNYNHEKDHYAEQQDIYTKEMNDTYQEERNNTQAHHETNQDHYAQHHNVTNYDFPSQANETAGSLTETQTGDRYEKKGTEYKEEGQDKIENYDVNGDSPSISYTRT